MCVFSLMSNIKKTKLIFYLVLYKRFYEFGIVNVENQELNYKSN